MVNAVCDVPETFHLPRIMTAALRGRSGKTVITLGLLRSFVRQGIVVQPFKKGPDFIDPGWHRAASSRISRNLDSFFMAPEHIRSVLLHASAGSDLSIIEGAMGLFDGMDLEGSSSSAEIAKITKTPVLLVVDTTRMTRTAAALVLGCQLFDRSVEIAGVILNRVRSIRHEELMREAIEATCDIPVVGALPVDAELTIPDRHLGLISDAEIRGKDELLDTLATVVESYVDTDAVLALAHLAEPLNSRAASVPAFEASPQESGTPAPKIAVIRDASFCFYYEENLQALRAHGAELLFINSLEDPGLPEGIDALYIGGGFPEEFASELEANAPFRASLLAQIENDLPVYAECGGLMYLGRTLVYQGQEHQMVGALPLDTEMQEKRQAHGYSVVEATETSPFFEPKTSLRGHEFHHSKAINLDSDISLTLTNVRGHGLLQAQDGISYKGVLALYTHVNAYASPAWAEQLVKKARSFQATRLCSDSRRRQS